MHGIVELLRRLVSIDSVNPSLVPGAAGEGECAAFVADWLKMAGADVEVVRPATHHDRPSVLGIVRGTGDGCSVLLYGHLDTVGVDGLCQPHEPIVQGDRLVGRGALDMKGGLAAILLAAAACHERGLAGDVYVAAVADEESHSLGMETVLQHFGAAKHPAGCSNCRRAHPTSGVPCSSTIVPG